MITNENLTVKLKNNISNIKDVLYSFKNRVNNSVKNERKQILKDLTKGYSNSSSEHFEVKSDVNNKEAMQSILSMCEDIYNSISQEFELELKEKVKIIKCCKQNTFKELLQKIYIEKIPKQAEVVFEADHIIISSSDSVLMLRTFIVHELSHLFVIELTKGNVPRWLLEGIARYHEFELASTLVTIPKKRILSYNQLNRKFSKFSEHKLESAYTQSALIVKLFISKYGYDKLIEILKRLGTGEKFDLQQELNFEYLNIILKLNSRKLKREYNNNKIYIYS